MRHLNEFYRQLKPGERPSVGTVLEKAMHQLKEFAGMFLYLWVLFSLFAIYKSIVRIEYPLNYPSQSLAFANAFVLAKVMLVAEDFHFGNRFQDRSLVYPIVYKAFVFTLILICFYVIEHMVFGMWNGLSVYESFPRFGGKGLEPIVAIALIMLVVLIPFCAFREIGRVVGRSPLRSLLFNREALDYRLEPARRGLLQLRRLRPSVEARYAPGVQALLAESGTPLREARALSDETVADPSAAGATLAVSERERSDARVARTPFRSSQTLRSPPA